MLSMRVLLSLLAFASSSRAAFYTISDSYKGTDFLTGFIHENITDPTHGRVTYVSQADALAKNLTYARGSTLIIRTDDTTVLSADGPGRDSVRLRSNKMYTTHVSIWNIHHMPQGCGTWPAVWEVGSVWPDYGEVDIVEGVNSKAPNQASFHTGAGKSLRRSLYRITETGGNNCDSKATNNTGCGVKDTRQDSFGPSFNDGGGGFYAMERAQDGIRVWFWSRGAAIPWDVKYGLDIIETSAWGTPVAFWPSTMCDPSKLGPHWLVINLTLCGDWAGADDVYPVSGCPDTCISFVDNNPSAFSQAYFEVEWAKVYE
ncbi:endo-beta-glucanase [Epithele typhae]|uniref:endo-beta-glucanase n=1 Tax=Epithele typhae TaxID=378194 RepID=UPI002008CC5F|nr:endo-beta-glucanase [Epithele typhae]KAH9913698.1 endo-beta-glucanase [Epithele typhae]